MPFKSDKQRKYLYANKPSVARQYASHVRKTSRKKSASNKGGGSIGNGAAGA